MAACFMPSAKLWSAGEVARLAKGQKQARIMQKVGRLRAPRRSRVRKEYEQGGKKCEELESHAAEK